MLLANDTLFNEMEKILDSKEYANASIAVNKPAEEDVDVPEFVEMEDD